MEKFIYQGNGERIDIFLAKNFAYSRNFFHHIMKRGGILVNGKTTKKSYKLKNNDQIKIENLERYLDSSFLGELPFINIPIILEKKDYLVLNKPKGVLSHPNSIWDLSAPSVVAFLYQKYKDLPSIGNFIRAGLIHRLDKETDGLIIVAKTEKGLKYFKDLFTKKSQLVEKIIEEMNKKKLSNVEIEKLEEKILLKKFYKTNVNITEKGKQFLKNIKLPHYIIQTVKPKVPHYIEKMGITKIINIKNKTNSCNLILQIITGRTHQIRYHLSKNGLPIIGDKLYGNKENILMQLTAYKLEFIDVKGEKIELEI